MPRWLKVVIAAVLPSTAGVLAGWICAASGLGLDITSIVVGLVVLLPGTPLAIWAGQPESSAGPLPIPNSDPRPVPAVIGHVPREPKAFQPRSDLSDRIARAFAGRDVAAVCALAGGRGVGKTHLAAAYARHCIDDGIPVAWMHSETVEQLHGSIDLMATELGLRDDADDATTVSRKVRAWLQARQEPYLVVVDNASDPDQLVPLLPSHGRARVLVTTNDHSFERLATLVTVEQFTENEAVRYLSTRVGTSDGDSFRTLADELGRLPLALAIAAAALVGPPRLSGNAYIGRLHNTPIDEVLARPRGERHSGLPFEMAGTGSAKAGFLVGSLARGTCDQWSDVDFHVVTDRTDDWLTIVRDAVPGALVSEFGHSREPGFPAGVFGLLDVLLHSPDEDGLGALSDHYPLFDSAGCRLPPAGQVSPGFTVVGPHFPAHAVNSFYLALEGVVQLIARREEYLIYRNNQIRIEVLWLPLFFAINGLKKYDGKRRLNTCLDDENRSVLSRLMNMPQKIGPNLRDHLQWELELFKTLAHPLSDGGAQWPNRLEEIVAGKFRRSVL